MTSEYWLPFSQWKCDDRQLAGKSAPGDAPIVLADTPRSQVTTRRTNIE